MNTIELQAETDRVTKALHPRPHFGNNTFRRALFYMLLVPAAAYVLTFIIASTPAIGLRHMGISKFGPVLDYGFEARHVDADILIFGDSSAFLGIDPRIVNQDLHARTAVIPNTIGSLPATADMPLQKYLSHNRKPKLLVLYFSSWNMNYSHARNTEFLFEGEEELLRYGSWKDILAFSLHHPLHILRFPFQAYSLLGVHNLVDALHHPDSERQALTAKAFGHLDYILPYPVLHTPCRLREQYSTGHDSQSVQDLVRRYGSSMHIVVYLAPVPGCSNAAQASSHVFPQLQPQPPIILPASWFADDGFFAHVRPEHVPDNSHRFAAGIADAWKTEASR